MGLSYKYPKTAAKSQECVPPCSRQANTPTPETDSRGLLSRALQIPCPTGFHLSTGGDKVPLRPEACGRILPLVFRWDDEAAANRGFQGVGAFSDRCGP
jgi:hypothetical protein